jgi:UMF1 family MFS transporter
LILWIVIILFAAFVETKEGFYLIGSVAGVALGSNQSASRTLLGLFAPRQQSAEFFGFFSLTGKVAATIGPLLYGELTRLFGQRPAVLSMSLFFLLGLILLQSVREEEGIRRATEMP